MINKLFFLFAFSMVFCPVLQTIGQSWKVYPYHQDETLLYFPADEGRHPAESVEWWYTVAHVTGDSTGYDYSYMLTYFSYDTLIFDGFRIFNIANETTGEFFEETMPTTYPLMEQSHLGINATPMVGPNEEWITLTDSVGNLKPFQYHIAAASAYGAIDVEYDAVKPPLIVGDSGFFYQGQSSFTYYYSQTELNVTGTITISDSLNPYTETVSGTSWIDRQWGNFNPTSGDKYEWFCMQLSNGMDLNVWNIFTPQNLVPDTTLYRLCSVFVDDTTSFTTSAFQLDRMAFSHTPDSVMCYSQEWQFTYGDIDLNIVTLHDNTEVSLPFRFYEGSTEITGTVGGVPVTGIGFAELLHSYENPQLQITYPVSGNDWDINQPVTWKVLNPDDGRNIYYEVELSTDNKATFSPIAQGVADTAQLFNSSTVPLETECWLRINGYSNDSTLFGTVEMSASSFTVAPLGTGLFDDITDRFSTYPNPFNEEVQIVFDLLASGEVGLEVRDLYGRLVKTIFTGHRGPGKHNMSWNGRDDSGQLLSPGMYCLYLKNNGFSMNKNIIVLR